MSYQALIQEHRAQCLAQKKEKQSVFIEGVKEMKIRQLKLHLCRGEFIFFQRVGNTC
jgi:hypothetical protein